MEALGGGAVSYERGTPVPPAPRGGPHQVAPSTTLELTCAKSGPTIRLRRNTGARFSVVIVIKVSLYHKTVLHFLALPQSISGTDLGVIRALDLT